MTLKGSDTLIGVVGLTPQSGEHTAERVLEKLGFIETGRVMRPCLAAGADVPSIRMQLSRTV